MHHTVLFSPHHCVLCCACASCYLPAADNAQGLPAGTYLGSCRGCQLTEDGAKVYCTHCPKACGKKVAVGGQPIDKCPFGFDNSDGELVCAKPPNAAGLPAGSFQDSCGGCRRVGGADGKVLACSHCDGGPDGAAQETSLELKEVGCESVGNRDGVLVCEQDKGAGGWRAHHEANTVGGAPPAPAGTRRGSILDEL